MKEIGNKARWTELKTAEDFAGMIDTLQMRRYIELECDSIDLRFLLTPRKKNQFELQAIPFVFGIHSPVYWANFEEDYARRFLHSIETSYYKKAEQKRIIRSLGKKKAKEEGYLDTYEQYQAVFTSSTILIKHLSANNSIIKMREPDIYTKIPKVVLKDIEEGEYRETIFVMEFVQVAVNQLSSPKLNHGKNNG